MVLFSIAGLILGGLRVEYGGPHEFFSFFQLSCRPERVKGESKSEWAAGEAGSSLFGFSPVA